MSHSKLPHDSALGGPQRTWMVLVGVSVECKVVKVALVQGAVEDLCALKEHFVDVLITVGACRFLWVVR